MDSIRKVGFKFSANNLSHVLFHLTNHYYRGVTNKRDIVKAKKIDSSRVDRKEVARLNITAENSVVEDHVLEDLGKTSKKPGAKNSGKAPENLSIKNSVVEDSSIAPEDQTVVKDLDKILEVPVMLGDPGLAPEDLAVLKDQGIEDNIQKLAAKR